MKVIEEKLTKTEITQGLQHNLDIEFTNNTKEWEEDWEETDNLIYNVTKTVIKYKNATKSVKRKLDEESESENLNKILKFEDYSQETDTDNQEPSELQNKSANNQSLIQSPPKWFQNPLQAISTKIMLTSKTLKKFKEQWSTGLTN